MIEINSKIYAILAFIGMITCCGIFGIFAMYVVSTIYWKIKLYELKYRQKHRFDKPPMAACYCRDCDKWDYDTGECELLPERKVKDDWFCKDAVRNVSLAEEGRRDLRDRVRDYIENKKKMRTKKED